MDRTEDDVAGFMAGRDVDNVDLGIVLGPARRDPHGHVPAILRNVDEGKGVASPARGRGRDFDLPGVHEQSFLAAQSLAYVQLGYALAGEKLLIEVAVAGKPLGVGDHCRRGRVEFPDAGEQFLAAWNAGQRRSRIDILILEPFLYFWIFQILHVTVVVDNLRPVIVVGDGAHRRDWRFHRCAALWLKAGSEISERAKEPDQY